MYIPTNQLKAASGRLNGSHYRDSACWYFATLMIVRQFIQTRVRLLLWMKNGTLEEYGQKIQ